MSYDEVLVAAQSLPVADRYRLIDELVKSVPERQVELSEAWWQEIERRERLAAEGKVRFKSWEEVRDEARRAVGLDDAT